MLFRSDFYNYKELINKYPILLSIKNRFDRFDIDDFQDKLEQIQKKYNNNIYIKSKDKNYYKEIIEYYTSIDDDISDEVLDLLSNNINKRENSFLLNPLKKEDYLFKTKYKDEDEFMQFFSLYNELEDSIES